MIKKKTHLITVQSDDRRLITVVDNSKNNDSRLVASSFGETKFVVIIANVEREYSRVEKGSCSCRFELKYDS